MIKETDILIVGGGIVGLSLACELAGSDFDVTIIDKNINNKITDRPQNRVSAINLFALERFEKLGVFQGELSERICCYQQMVVWAQQGAGEICFDSATLNLPKNSQKYTQGLGAIIENNVLQQLLINTLKQADNIHYLCPEEITKINYFVNTKTQDTKKQTNVELASGETINTKLLIGADGVNSKVREIAHIQRLQKSYQQHAIVCNINTSINHQNTAWQCFMPTGPLALLPLYNGESSIVWTVDDDVLEHSMSLDDSEFMQALASASEYRLGEITTVTQRYAYPLTHGHSQHYVEEGLALIGDAAHNIHPLAGQGANLGIADASELAQLLLQAKQSNRQWFSKHNLQKYQRQRLAKNQLMEHTMTGFKNLFGNKNGFVDVLRNMGLNVINQLPAVKAQLIRQALGY